MIYLIHEWGVKGLDLTSIEDELKKYEITVVQPSKRDKTEGFLAILLFGLFLVGFLIYQALLEYKTVSYATKNHVIFLSIEILLLVYPLYKFLKGTKYYDTLYEEHGIEVLPKNWRFPTPSGKEIPVWNIPKNMIIFAVYIVLILVTINLMVFHSELFVDLRKAASTSGIAYQTLWLLIGIVFGAAFSALFQSMNVELMTKKQALVLFYFFSLYLLFLFIINLSIMAICSSNTFFFLRPCKY